MKEKFSKIIVKNKILILIISVILLIPSIIGYFNTRINYDILSYLPKDIETMKGQDIMVDQFGTGGFSLIVTELPDKDITKLKEKIENVDGVNKVICPIIDESIPLELLPNNLYNSLKNGDSTLLAVTFSETMSEDSTLLAIEKIRDISNRQCFLSGMSAVILDTRNLSEKETPIYVLIAVICSVIILMLTMDSFLIPILFLLSIGMSIVYNLGTNFAFGEISFVTKALAAVLQLGVTMDYFIFLWHSYEEEKGKFSNKDIAMQHAISNTITSVTGSSITTISGFIALCFMSFTLGLDLGIVMAKGVLFGVLACITILPSLILVCDKALEKTKHKSILPDFKKIPSFIIKHYKAILIIFLIIWIPAIYGNNHTDVYYNLDETLPKDLESIIANEKLKDNFDMASTHMILIDSKKEQKDIKMMVDEINDVKGVKTVLGLDVLKPETIPEELISKDIKETFKSEKYEYMLVMSEFKTASNEVNEQCKEINSIIKKYDKNAMLIGEAPCTKDLIEITDNDFKTVNSVSIGIIFIIIACVFASGSIPIILVLTIEFAIYINMSIPYYTNTIIPFISSIVIGTIQLGATVDYAILMTSRYRAEKKAGKEKIDAINIALTSSMKSIIVSGLSFFGATFGVGLYSNIDMISSLCELMSRGALISMITVITVLPAMLMVFDKIIQKTSLNRR